MTTLNCSLLERTMHQIEVDPRCFDNSVWGATLDDGRVVADFAGWATMLYDGNQRPPRGRRDASDGQWTHGQHWVVHGLWMPSYAARVLGLNVGQREVMFHHHWSAAALRAGVDALVRSDGGISGEDLAVVMRTAQA